jgi:hypothetical protein
MSNPNTVPVVASIDPLHLFRDDIDGLAAVPKARIRAALAGGRFLAALLSQHGADTELEGDNLLTACPEWTYGIGAALSAVLHSIEAACDEVKQAQQWAAENLQQQGDKA